MILLPQTIIQIVAAGGGVTLDLKKHILLPATLVQIAAAAGQSGAQVKIVGITVLLPQTMIQIAAAGRGNVMFDLR